MAKKKKGQKRVLEAVDTLSHLADLDAEKPEQVEWLDPAKVEQNQETIRETFQAINGYLQHMYQKDRGQLASSQTQKGIRAMMQLAGEAVDKVDQYTGLFKGAHAKDETLSEFKKLQQFYLSKVFSKIKKETGEEAWELEGEFKSGAAEHQILKDLETIRQDRDYELFYMTHADGTVFFSSTLLRHLRLVGNFDETFISAERENTLTRFESALDRDLHVSAQRMLQECSDLIDLFYKEALHHKENETLMQVSKAVIALLLAANPKNLQSNTQGKCVIDYWNDFLLYLRLGLETENYQKWHHASSKNPSSINQVCLRLMHRMCHTLFLRTGAKHDDLELLHHLMGKELDLPIWASLAHAEGALAQELQHYPSGPLMKTLKMFREQENQKGFDPIIQDNPPSQIFTLTTEELHTTVIHLPAPVHQKALDQAEATPEFKGYLHSLAERNHLYVNLQDRNSWKGESRCKLLETLSEKGEFSQNFHVITLPKDSHFYHQVQQYGTLDNAKEFCQACEQEIVEGADFYFPTGKTPKGWMGPLVKFIHHHFFAGLESLDRKQRLDFIEILYFFITLRYLDQERSDVLSFSCKDGIDTGAAASAAFYGFARMLSSNIPWTESDRDCFLFTLFTPALFVRHRSIEFSRLQRALSALEHFESVLKENRDKVLKECAKILPEIPLGSLKISDVA